MFKSAKIMGGAILCTLLQVMTIPGMEPPAGQEEARKVALEFIKAWRAGDSKALGELSSLPWGWDFTEIYKTRDQLDVLIRDIVKTRHKNKIFTDQVHYVDSYKDFRGKVGKDYQRKWLDEILSPGDCVVAMEHPKDRQWNVYLFVRFKDSKATLVGFAVD